ncbi:uncharacterized protein V6R79_001286 [Siganus canaliculatus]
MAELKATLEAMKQEKEAQAALAEATILEAAVDQEIIEKPSGFGNVDQDPVHTSAERTEKYVQEQREYINARQLPDNPQMMEIPSGVPSDVQSELHGNGDEPEVFPGNSDWILDDAGLT